MMPPSAGGPLRIPGTRLAGAAPAWRASAAAVPRPASAAPVAAPRRNFTGVRIHAAVVAVIAALYWIGDAPSTLIVGGVLIFCTYILLGVREGRRAPLWLSPLSFYLLYSSVGLGLSAIYIGNRIAASEWVPFATRQVHRENVAAAYVLYLASSVALHLGMQLFRPLRADAETEQAADLGAGRVGALVVLWITGMLTSMSPAVAHLFAGAGGFMKLGAFAAVSAFALTPRQQLRLSWTAWVAGLAVGTGGLFAANLMSYSKAFLMYSFLPVIWLFLLRPRLRPMLPLLGTGLVVFYFGLVAPIVSLARLTPLKPGQNAASHLLNTASLALSGATYAGQEIGTADRPTIGYQTERFLNRTYDPMPLGFVMGEVKQHGFLDGTSFNRLAYALIPRVVWPDKPVVSQGAWFAVYLGFAESEETTTSVWGITAAGELYWNFGIPGVLLGMLLIGMLMGGLWNMAGADPRRKPVRMLLYTIIMINIVNMETAVTVLVFATLLFVVFRFALFGLRMVPRNRPAADG